MKIFTITKQSIGAIFTNKGRSFLTVLGIVIGIGSVIALMSLGNGVRSKITQQIAALGTTTLMVTPGSGFGHGGFNSNEGRNVNDGNSMFTTTDYMNLLDRGKNPSLELVAGQVAGSGTMPNSEERFSVTGTSPSLFSIRNIEIEKGRLFTSTDINGKTKVAVLGNDLAAEALASKNPIGKNISLQNEEYEIIGVLKKASESNFLNPNFEAYVPYSSAMSTFGSDRFDLFTVKATNENSVGKAKTEIENTLLKSHRISDPKLADFTVSTSQDLLSTVGNITNTLTALLSGIAAISLLVGGIGIMNIMLVSVTERTHEIGLRKAVGAKTADILVQFLIEAIFLTLAGGILGIALGIVLGKIAGRYIGFDPVTTINSIILAVGISTFVGLVFGLYPAFRAARLNPIDALRYE